MRPVEHLLSLKPTVEVTGKVKQPRTLRANFGADKADALFPIPVLPDLFVHFLNTSLIAASIAYLTYSHAYTFTYWLAREFLGLSPWP
jgi:hypothetical protein